MSNKLIGTQIGNHRIERLLGKGGMASVLLATDVSLQRKVALKVIDSRFQDNEDYARRFIQEARSIANWRHENIIQIYYAAEEDGLYYFTMEFIDGIDLVNLLKQYSQRNELMPTKDIVRIAQAIASALDYAHNQGIIHRDIKPANVLLDKDGRVVLTDFGLALDLTQGTVGDTFGTAHYVAPEQAQNSADASAQSDIYSFGVMLFEMMTGSVPFDGDSATGIAIQHISSSPPSPRSINPNLGEATEKVLLKALAKLPSERYETATEYVNALVKALHEDSLISGELPPVPAAVREKAPRMSELGVSKQISEFRRQRAALAQTDGGGITAPTEEQPEASAEKQRGVLFAGLGALAIILALIAGFVILNGSSDGDDDNPNGQGLAAESPTSITDTPSATHTQPTATDADVIADVTATSTATNTATNTATDTLAPTDTASPSATATVRPTDTQVASPIPTNTTRPSSTPTATFTQTATPTATPPPTSTPTSSEPTIAFPDGYQLNLIYNDVSLVMHNPGTQRQNVEPFIFEALDANGQPVEREFEGTRWSAVANYGYIDSSDSCTRVEVSGADGTLLPDFCNNYNAVVTPISDDPMLFWLDIDGATQFRIMYNQQELGRCPVFIGTEEMACEIRLP